MGHLLLWLPPHLFVVFVSELNACFYDEATFGFEVNMSIDDLKVDVRTATGHLYEMMSVNQSFCIFIPNYMYKLVCFYSGFTFCYQCYFHC